MTASQEARLLTTYASEERHSLASMRRSGEAATELRPRRASLRAELGFPFGVRTHAASPVEGFSETRAFPKESKILRSSSRRGSSACKQYCKFTVPVASTVPLARPARLCRRRRSAVAAPLELVHAGGCSSLSKVV